MAIIRTYVLIMPLPRPIRFDADTWLVMRSDPVVPKAVIQRWRDRKGDDLYLLVKWDLDPSKRILMGVFDSLDKANELVRYDLPDKGDRPGGSAAFGAYSGAQSAKR